MGPSVAILEPRRSDERIFHHAPPRDLSQRLRGFCGAPLLVDLKEFRAVAGWELCNSGCKAIVLVLFSPRHVRFLGP